MELDELEKRLEWLDSERQKSNSLINELKDQISGYEDAIKKQGDKLSILENELKNIPAISNRVTQFDEVFSRLKIDHSKQIIDLEKKLTPQIKNLEKQQRDDVSLNNKKIAEVQTITPAINEVKKNIQARIDEESRISQRIDSLEKLIDSKKDFEPQITLNLKRLSDDFQLESKKRADSQIEAIGLRKRMDEERNRNDINAEALRKLEIRLGALEGIDIERKQYQAAFIEKVSLAQIERDNIWKEWQARIDEINTLGDNFSTKIEALEATHRAIKKSQTELDDVNIRFDRRINELTEMHRLTEERFRQEWISFKTDDQKRWTNYLLTQEEQQQEDGRQQAKIFERITIVEDAAQEAKDAIGLITDETEKQLKAFLSLMHEVMESFEQTFSKR